MTHVADIVATVLAARDDVDAAEIAEILEAEFVGSALDIFDAVGHLFGDEEEARHLADALFEAMQNAPRKRPRLPTIGAASGLSHCAWKREYMSDHARFQRPYIHDLDGVSITLQQAPFCPEGFASTVWDSSIVLARYLERESARFTGRRCIELGAGCGLPGLVLHAIGADVSLTDLAGNLPLLNQNARANTIAGAPPTRVCELSWGGTALPSSLFADGGAGGRPFDVILATDVLYTREAVYLLVETLVALAAWGRPDAPADGAADGPADVPAAEILLAAGRNRHAGDDFFAIAASRFAITLVPAAELHPIYQCDDVSVWQLRLRPPAPPPSPSAPVPRVVDLDGVRYACDGYMGDGYRGHGCRGDGKGNLRRILADVCVSPPSTPRPHARPIHAAHLSRCSPRGRRGDTAQSAGHLGASRGHSRCCRRHHPRRVLIRRCVLSIDLPPSPAFSRLLSPSLTFSHFLDASSFGGE